MEIKHRESDTKGAFYIEGDGKTLAEMTYSKAGDNVIIIDHTEVSDALRGKGAGKQLVARAVEHARTRKLKVMPLCPFAKSVFDAVSAYRDVLQ